MSSAATVTKADQLERSLLRHGVDALEASRHRCSDCGRTPLIGERVHSYDGPGGGTVCELCRMLRVEQPAASALVRHGEHGCTVRLTTRAA